MYGATRRRRTAPARSPATPSRPCMRRRYGEDRLTAGVVIVLAVVAAFGALGPSTTAGAVVVAIVLGGAGVGGPPGLRRARADRAPRRPPTAAPSPASRRGSRWRGSSGRSPRPRSGSRSRSAWPSSPSAWSRPPCSTCARCGRPSGPTSGDPFDPVELARRRLDHAAEWHRRELDRLAVTELSGVDRPRPGHRHAARRPRRSAAWTSCAPRRCRPGRSTPATSSGHWPGSASSSSDSSAGPAVSRARASRSSGAAVRTSGSTDDDVTVQLRRAAAKREDRLRHSRVRSGRPRPPSTPGRPPGVSSPTAMSTPSSRTGASSPSSSTASSRSSAKLHVRLVAQLRGDLGLDVGGDRRLADGHHVHDRERVGIVGRRRLVDDLADRGHVDLPRDASRLVARVRRRRDAATTNDRRTSTARRPVRASPTGEATSRRFRQRPTALGRDRGARSAQRDDPLHGAVRPAVGQVGRQVG